MSGIEHQYKIVFPEHPDEPPRLKRKLRRSSCLAPVASLEEDDPAIEEEYERQVQESDGFEVDQFPFPYGGIHPHIFKDKYDYPPNVGLVARLGLHCYNLQKGTDLRLIGINIYNTEMFGMTYLDYITLEAMDTSNNSSCDFQTCVCNVLFPEEASLIVYTELARLKVPTGPRITPVGPQRGWDHKEISEFYKGKLPNWSTIERMADSSFKGQFYELQQSDLQENEWLQLYAEFTSPSCLLAYDGKKVDIKKVVIQTEESGEESPRMKLKANNAIFYMSFKRNGDPSVQHVEYQAVVRKTMDGKPGHIRLEVDRLANESNAE